MHDRRGVCSSCSAEPSFNLKIVNTSDGPIKLLDGGYSANNPTLYTIADTVKPLGLKHVQLRIVSVEVGVYPEPPEAVVNTAGRAADFHHPRLLSVILTDFPSMTLPTRPHPSQR
jgi:hypothetical protein